MVRALRFLKEYPTGNRPISPGKQLSGSGYLVSRIKRGIRELSFCTLTFVLGQFRGRIIREHPITFISDKSIIFERGEKFNSEVSRRTAGKNPSKTHFDVIIPIFQERAPLAFPRITVSRTKSKKRINYLDRQFPLVSTRDASLNHRDDLDLVQSVARTFSSRRCEVHG